MKCTGCGQGQLKEGLIDGLFKGRTCNYCGGYWLLVDDYLSWKDNHPDYTFAEDVVCEEDISESTRALLCPASGSLMSKFKIASTSPHRIDYSASVGGIWLDKGEWSLLKGAGLANSLNSIVTQTWQHKLRSDSAKEHFRKMYREKFGEESYGKVKEFREWLTAQANSADLKSYIMSDDPYSAER